MKVLYIITDGEYYKIGFSSDIEKRLKQIQTGNPKKIEFIKGYETKYANRIEKELHFKLSNKRIKGEWFDLGKQDLQFIDDYINENGEKYIAYKKVDNKHFMKKFIDRKINLLITKELREVDLGFLYKVLNYIDEENVIDFKRLKIDYQYNDSKLSKAKRPLFELDIIKEDNHGFIYLNPLVGIKAKEINQELLDLFKESITKYGIEFNY